MLSLLGTIPSPNQEVKDRLENRDLGLEDGAGLFRTDVESLPARGGARWLRGLCEYCRAKPKDSSCLLYKQAVTAFWLCWLSRAI